MRGAGEPLPAPVRAFFEPRFGRDFSQVRVHAGRQAGSLARTLQASAFTVGRDIFLDPREYAPGSPKGRGLLAHELTHVAQQGYARSSRIAAAVPQPVPVTDGIPSTSTPTVSCRVSEELDYETIIRQVHEAIDSRNAVALLFALERLERDVLAVQRFRREYRRRYGESVVVAISYVLSQSQQRYALQLLGMGSRRATQRIEGVPQSPAVWNTMARRIRSDLERPDSGTVFAVLYSMRGQSSHVARLMRTYAGLYGEALVDSLQRGLSGRDIGYARSLLRLAPSPTAVAALTGFERLPPMQWTPTTAPGTGCNTDFCSWVTQDMETAAPTLSSSTTANCWEAILLAAHSARLVSWRWLHDLYARYGRRGDVAFADMLSRGPRVRYTPDASPPRVPIRGDIVFFWRHDNHLSHAGLATGRGERASPEILQFQGQMGGPPTTVRIEPPSVYLSEGRPMRVEFARPPW